MLLENCSLLPGAAGSSACNEETGPRPDQGTAATRQSPPDRRDQVAGAASLPTSGAQPGSPAIRLVAEGAVQHDVDQVVDQRVEDRLVGEVLQVHRALHAFQPCDGDEDVDEHADEHVRGHRTQMFPGHEVVQEGGQLLARPRSLKESIEQLNERAIVHVSGLPLRRPADSDAGAPLVRRLHEVDEMLFARIAGWESPPLDRFLPALSQAASHSKIWIAFAAAMSIVGGRKGRRTAVQSLAAVAVTSLLANLVAKGLFRRRRPSDQADQVPDARRLPMPVSSSMPSGHSASAAAFSGVVGAAYPRLRLPLDVLAAAIGFSRVYTGVHYPTDVVAGWLLGRGIGTLVRGLAAAGRIRRTPAPWPAERTVRS